MLRMFGSAATTAMSLSGVRDGRGEAGHPSLPA